MDDGMKASGGGQEGNRTQRENWYCHSRRPSPGSCSRGQVPRRGCGALSWCAMRIGGCANPRGTLSMRRAAAAGKDKESLASPSPLWRCSGTTTCFAEVDGTSADQRPCDRDPTPPSLATWPGRLDGQPLSRSNICGDPGSSLRFGTSTRGVSRANTGSSGAMSFSCGSLHGRGRSSESAFEPEYKAESVTHWSRQTAAYRRSSTETRSEVRLCGHLANGAGIGFGCVSLPHRCCAETTRIRALASSRSSVLGSVGGRHLQRFLLGRHSQMTEGAKNQLKPSTTT